MRVAIPVLSKFSHYLRTGFFVILGGFVPRMSRVVALIKSLIFLLGISLVISCGGDKTYTLLWHELNTSGVKHIVRYDKVRPVAIIFETFHGSGAKDTTGTDSVLRREIDSIKYDFDENTILLTRPFDDSHKDFRKYYFNSDNLLTRITRFGSNEKEYATDSVAYDYTSRKAFFYDIINKQVYELVYDNKNNIESETRKRVSDQHVFEAYYYYYDASSNPFLVNLDEDETLFGCFNMNTIGLFWNNATRPMFSSKNNVQSFKEVNGAEERNGLFEYHYAQGLPLVQFGTNSVIYRRYVKVQE